MGKTIRRFVVGFCFMFLIAPPVFLSTELSPDEAVEYIKAELAKKGLKNLTVKYGNIVNDDTQHNIFIEFGSNERTIQDVTDIWYESALIVLEFAP